MTESDSNKIPELLKMESKVKVMGMCDAQDQHSSLFDVFPTNTSLPPKPCARALTSINTFPLRDALLRSEGQRAQG